MDRLHTMWEKQREFSRSHYDAKTMTSLEREAKTRELALTLHHEVSRVVSSINFKGHRPPTHKPDANGVLYESVDVVRYAMAICTLWGFDADAFAAAWSDKDAFLDKRRELEEREWDGRPALVVDIDDVVADFREGFSRWVMEEKGIAADPSSPEYFFIEQLKDTGYSALALYEEFIDDHGLMTFDVNPIVHVLNELHDDGVWIHLLTARPYDNLVCRYDTYKWLNSSNLSYDRVDFAGEKLAFVTRTPYCIAGRVLGCIDDSPSNCSAYVMHGIDCVMPVKTYNASMPSGQKLHRYNSPDELYEILSKLHEGIK